VKSIQNAKDGGYSKTLAKLIKKAEETKYRISSFTEKCGKKRLDILHLILFND
jgi:hypothetical protein